MIIWPKLIWQEDVREITPVGGKRMEYRELHKRIKQSDLPITREAMGIDPGRNFGIAVVSPLEDRYTDVRIAYGNLHMDPEWHYTDDGDFAYQIAVKIFGARVLLPTTMEVGVEAAAFSSSPGQANLAYIRYGFFLAAKHAGYPTSMVAINTARKSATGKGTVPMWDLLPNMNENAADALGVALHMAGYRAPPPTDD
jgi:hypothetical protein